MKSLSSEIGPRLMEFRRKKGKSQGFVQEKTGLSRPTISKIEKGIGYVNPFTAHCINQMIKNYGGVDL